MRQFLYTIYIPSFFLAFCQGLLALVLPLFAIDLNLSYGLIGLALASIGLGTLVGDLPAGAVHDRIGHRLSMMISISMMGVGMLALSQTNHFITLMLCGLSIGAGSTLWYISRHAYLTDTVVESSRGRAIAIFGGTNRIGMFAGPIVGGFLSASAGMRVAFLFCGAVAFLALIFPLLFATESHLVLSTRKPQSTTRSYRRLLLYLRRNMWVLLYTGVGTICAQAVRAGRIIIIPLYAASVLDLNVQSIGLVVGIAAAVDMLMFYPAGYLMDHFGRKYAYVPSFLLQAVGIALIPFTSSFATLLAVTSLIGFGNGLGSGTMMTLGADLAPKKGQGLGAFLGLWRLVGDIGQTSGPLIVGAIADMLGLMPSVYVIVAVGLMAASILGLLVPETRKKPSQGGPELAIP